MAIAIENEAGADLFATSIRLLQANGKPKGRMGYSLQQPLGEPNGKTLVINATFNIFDPMSQQAHDLRISLKDDPTYIAVAKDGRYAEHTKSMAATTLEGCNEEKFNNLREITSGVAATLLGGQV
jgi:hypothetical protein